MGDLRSQIPGTRPYNLRFHTIMDRCALPKLSIITGCTIHGRFWSTFTICDSDLRLRNLATICSWKSSLGFGSLSSIFKCPTSHRVLHSINARISTSCYEKRVNRQPDSREYEHCSLKRIGITFPTTEQGSQSSGTNRSLALCYRSSSHMCYRSADNDFSETRYSTTIK